MNIRGAPLFDRDTVPLPGYLKYKEVGHYPYSMKKLVVGLHPYFKQLPNSNLSVNRASTSVLAVLDREYGNACWVLALTQASILADCLMRVRKNAGLWSAPPAYSGRGRPRKHGQKMRLNDPTTWLEADTA
ncbi:transposase, partial [Microcoleus sp. AT9_B4]